MTEEILIVDDNPGIRLLLQDILANEGYQITAATTGKEAAECVKTKTFDAVILDYNLPIISGTEVLKQMNDANIHTPAIVITGIKEMVQTELSETGLEAVVIAKPFDVTEICTRVNDVISEEEKIKYIK